MFDTLTTMRLTMESLAGEFDSEALSGEEAVRVVTVLGAIHRLTDGLLAKAARRVADTSAHARDGDSSAAQFYARAVGVGVGEAHRVLGMAKRLEALPATAAAVREGRLSGRQAQLVAGAATRNPRAERELLAAARAGMVPLRDACVAARAAVEDPERRRARQHRVRRLRVWTADDGMIEGHFRLEPEVGGPCKAVLDSEVQRIFRQRRKSGEHESHEAYAADAFATLILEGNDSRGTVAKRAATSVHVVIDHAALVRGHAIGRGGPVDAGRHGVLRDAR
jgi:hypothetical protein